ncbi:hypothetical protein NDU88_005479 [Pleurodeles waltl]|uniref:RBR-type E3 ubiquitin transferase n=1 Tax=Pleurodeles waltl TaxID=8319 RepID=A0AAV7PFN2_PLEWA|nr:hypothetical protein NDU88_005479 [Pleurodeles waltl]
MEVHNAGVINPGGLMDLKKYPNMRALILLSVLSTAPVGCVLTLGTHRRHPEELLSVYISSQSCYQPHPLRVQAYSGELKAREQYTLCAVLLQDNSCRTMASEDKDAQEDELLALTSIYADDEFQRSQHIRTGQIKVCVELPKDFRICVSGNYAKNPPTVDFKVCFLPPVVLTFELPAHYPSASAPVFQLSCKWLTPVQVKELVAEELFSRYDRLLLQSSLNSMTDVVYCPRLNCQTPVVKEPGGTMGICSNCRYAFCDLCKMTYHGVTPCAQPEENEDTDDVVFLPHTPLSRKQRKFKKWEEGISNQCIEENCKKCPRCEVNIEKNGGCRGMCCTNCLLNFCWNCFLPTDRYDMFTEGPSARQICKCKPW